jgi:serine/threonine-protein kinase
MYDGFRLTAPLGDGGMGVIWLAEEVALRRTVVLKFLRPERLASPDALARFRREALAEARVRHPGIVTVYAVGHAHGQPYIAQEYVEGGRTLAHWIEESRQRDDRSHAYFQTVAELVGEACAALHVAHAADVIHRDVKPQNLLLTPEGRLKVADFGLARVKGGDTVTDDGVALGTPLYSSPEQISGRRELDARTDVFGLGATLYELLTFRRAFDAESTEAILERVLHHDPPDPQTVSRHVPRDQAILCNKALEKRAEDRFASMQLLVDELRRYLRDEPLLTHSPSSIHRARKWVRRHPTATTSAAVLFLCACLVAWMWGRSSGALADSQRELLLAKTSWALGVDDLARAAAWVAEVNALDPGDYTGHLLLAAG